MVALTKIDMVDPDLLELAKEDVASFLEGTFLEGSSIFPVSSVTGEGLEALRQAIRAQSRELAPRRRRICSACLWIASSPSGATARW